MEYKALTYISIPFLDKTYAPGQMIPDSEFEESAQLAADTINDPNTEIVTAEAMIADLIEWGSLSEDPDAELHPSHRPVVPGAPTVVGLVEQAKILLAQLEEAGEEVPDEIRLLAESRELVSSSDGGSAGESSAT